MIRLLMVVGMLLVLALPAQADAKSCGSGSHFVFCYGSGEEIGAPIADALGLAGLSVLVSKVGAVEAKAVCSLGFFSGGELLTLGLARGQGTAKECKMEKPSNCNIPSEITGTSIAVLTGEHQVEFVGSGSEGAFVTVTVSGTSCAIVGSYTITGSQLCELPGATVAKVEHEIVCKKSGSKLKIGAETASVSGTAIDLVAGSNSGLEWYVGKGE